MATEFWLNYLANPCRGDGEFGSNPIKSLPDPKMVLTDREILSALNSGLIKINPQPNAQAYSSTSLDLALSAQLNVWNLPPTGVEQVVCPTMPGFKFNTFKKECSKVIQIPDDGYILEPDTLTLGWTIEEIELPAHAKIAARVEGKSTLARLGIGIHITAPTIHAGFIGPIQLEICNHGKLRVKITKGMPICQLIFEQTLGTPDKGYAGQFQKQQKS